jgi:hypothetical protein
MKRRTRPRLRPRAVRLILLEAPGATVREVVAALRIAQGWRDSAEAAR